MPVRPARPLTAKEKRQLDNWDRTLDGSLTRVLVVAGVLGSLAEAGMTWWLSSDTLASGRTVGALSSEFLFLSGAERLVGAGALQVLVESGLTPPAVGVALFGDLPFATLVPSGITVVRPPARELGVTAATLLLERINGDKQPSRSIVLSNEISTV